MPNSDQTLQNSISREVACKSDQNISSLHPFSYSHSEVLPVKSQFPHALRIRPRACDTNEMQVVTLTPPPPVCERCSLPAPGGPAPPSERASQPGGAQTPATLQAPQQGLLGVWPPSSPPLTLDTPPAQEKSLELPQLNPLTAESQARDLVV